MSNTVRRRQESSTRKNNKP